MQCQIIEGHVREFVDGNKILVTGDPADMIFGTYLMGVCLKKPKNGEENPFFGNLDKPWRLHVPDYMSHKGLLSLDRKDEWLTWI